MQWTIGNDMFDQQQFLDDLGQLIRFKTCVGENPEHFAAARAWIKAYFDPETTDIIEVAYGRFSNMLIRPRDSRAPGLLGDGHIEVVPGGEELFELRDVEGLLYGRGVADMKSQCLMMMWVLRELIAEGKHNDFWLLLTEDEEIGSANGVEPMVGYLAQCDWLPDVVFVPDGGPDFAYVEKEKGMIKFSATVPGKAAHGSRPFLGENAIHRMSEFYDTLRGRFPNPKSERDWIPSLSMTKIKAGEAYNKIPDSCWAGFDLRFTEDYAPQEVIAAVRQVGAAFEADLLFHEIGRATYYSRERPLARRYIDILRRVSGKEPQILHSNGASNGRFYAARNPDIQVLMSNPRVVGLHADEECLVATSLEPYYRLVRQTALMV
jgi:succinyl-diaminopimelate desuccinylase